MTMACDILKKVDHDKKGFIMSDLNTYIMRSKPEYEDGISGLKDFLESLDLVKNSVLINTMIFLIKHIHSNCDTSGDYNNYKSFSEICKAIKRIDKREEVDQLTLEKSQLQTERESLTQKNTSLLSEKDSLSSQLDELTEQSKALCEELDQTQMAMNGTHHACMSIV